MESFFSEGMLIDTRENIEHLASSLTLRAAHAANIILEQRAALFDRNKNLIVPLGPMNGIMPYHECALGLREGNVRDISIISRVGKPVCFVITDFITDSQGKPAALLSRRAVQQRCAEEYIARLQPGDIIPCRVTHIERFGCFVDVGCGIAALLTIDAIAVSRINHPADHIHVGMDLRCVVRAVDQKNRLLLSHKELLGTWEQNAAQFAAGETVVGAVRSIEDYGIFVELTPNLAGLADPVPGVATGDLASVYIKSICPERMKVKLVIIDSMPPTGEPPRDFTYFESADHIHSFRYSPACCNRVIETVFDEPSAITLNA